MEVERLTVVPFQKVLCATNLNHRSAYFKVDWLMNIVRFDIKDTLRDMNTQWWTSNNHVDSIRWQCRALSEMRHTEENQEIGHSTFGQQGGRGSPAFVPAQQDLIILTLEILARDRVADAATHSVPYMKGSSKRSHRRANRRWDAGRVAGRGQTRVPPGSDQETLAWMGTQAADRVRLDHPCPYIFARPLPAAGAEGNDFVQRGARAVRSVRSSEPTWYIRLPPVSKDKGQYSMPRGGQGQAGATATPTDRDHLGSLPVLNLTYDLPGELAGIARRGATPGGLVAIGVSPKRVTPFEAPAALFRPHVVPISKVISESLWDPSAIRRSDSGKVGNTALSNVCLSATFGAFLPCVVHMAYVPPYPTQRMPYLAPYRLRVALQLPHAYPTAKFSLPPDPLERDAFEVRSLYRKSTDGAFTCGLGSGGLEDLERGRQ
ncbi:hypothetical protein EDB89DRAFT_1905083 [Lactarius sanguifluus]|nr:hypothetical protein EDB89DRAFT_1905083 [Lactarius sanguifluus]